MRTSDFSKAPRLGRAEALVVTDATRTLRGHDGFVSERRWREHGVGGTIAWFGTPDQARAAASAASAASVRDGGFVHVYLAHESGYSNGVWRAEGGPMEHEERFTQLTRELDRNSPGPIIADPAAPRWSKRRATAAAPPAHRGLADAGAMFVGATRFRGPISVAIQSRTWFPMVRRMRQLPGFRWLGIYWTPPFTLGTIAFFRSTDDMLVFARIPEHRHLMRWIVQGGKYGRGGWIRMHEREDA